MKKIIYDFDKGVSRRGTDAKKFDPSLCPDDVLPFWIADTEFPSPIEVKDALLTRVKEGHYGYPYINSKFEESIARWYKVRHNVELDVNLIDFSPCVIPGMIWFVKEFTSIGDKVVLQTPVYPPFHDLVKNNGRQLVYNELKLIEGRYEIDFEDLENKLNDPKVKMLFICNPQNPTGRNFTKEELTKIGNLCLKYDVMIGVDEIHADIVFDNEKFVSFCSISDEFAKNSVTFLNPAKTFNVAGVRTAAWFTHNKKIYDRMINQQTYNKGMGRNIFGNVALEACFNYGDDYADQLVKYLNETKNQVVKYIADNIPKIKAVSPEATFMIWLDCRDLGFKNQKELMDFFINKAKVLLNDGTTFGKDEGLGFARFNFATQRNIVMEGLERIKDAVNNL
ncbi:MalY/PatB family protein [Miniphocaeibacter halophilus]|uniref:Pyridoxal phosphate-dependent aminotransferase n=1 Tax=Miniphocaeibacter halophilus TaxID=2931922 RepID=A0AC61MQ54_9FIRM|nr:MalY/PatB family protein [Miniphocaeibacter halophilus]QQK07782.1 pyridoxal phosphate-dependent aminotransferase [Miniphocaeibacter halophilus]